MSAADGDLLARFTALKAAFERLSVEKSEAVAATAAAVAATAAAVAEKAAAVAEKAAAERTGRLQRLETLRPTALPT